MIRFMCLHSRKLRVPVLISAAFFMFFPTTKTFAYRTQCQDRGQCIAKWDESNQHPLLRTQMGEFTGTNISSGYPGDLRSLLIDSANSWASSGHTNVAYQDEGDFPAFQNFPTDDQRVYFGARNFDSGQGTCGGSIAADGCAAIQTSQNQNGAIIGCKARLDSNPSKNWNASSIRRVATHELGHCLGMGHSSDYAVMSNTNPAPTIQTDDVRGIQALYGSNMIATQLNEGYNQVYWSGDFSTFQTLQLHLQWIDGRGDFVFQDRIGGTVPIAVYPGAHVVMVTQFIKHIFGADEDHYRVYINGAAVYGYDGNEHNIAGSRMFFTIN